MKHIIAFCLIAFTASSCGEANAGNDAQAAQPGSTATGLTSVEWIEPTKDLGTIKEGQKLQISFHFKNTGTAPLILQSVVPGCGCTLADYPKEAIAPGKEADITASFDSQGREGQQHKEITVTANTKESSQHKLSFNVMVVKAPKS